jgi:hypothetical protein
MGGQDWPKAIQALENVAKNDRNRTGPYCCIFGIAIDRGSRYIKREKKTGRAYSENTEVWLSDFFWPFFSNHSLEGGHNEFACPASHSEKSQSHLYSNQW